MAPAASNKVMRMVVGSTIDKGPTTGPLKQGDIEAAWASAITTRDGVLEPGGRLPFSVMMSGRAMDDAAIKRWCTWFDTHYSKVSAGRELLARDINFSNNQLTAAGIKHLFAVLMRKNINVTILKLYQNQISTVAEVVEFLCWCNGNMKELHLSHNRLDAAAAHDVILAAVTAKNSKDICQPCYPRNGGYAMVPLWLRLEKNLINATALDAQLKASLAKIECPLNKAICHVNGTTECNPGVCISCKGTVAAVHLTHITQQAAFLAPSIRALPTPQKTPGTDPGVRTPKATAGVVTPKVSKPSRGWGQTQEPEAETPTNIEVADDTDGLGGFPALQFFPALASNTSKPKEKNACPQVADEKTPQRIEHQVVDDPPVEPPAEDTEVADDFPALPSGKPKIDAIQPRTAKIDAKVESKPEQNPSNAPSRAEPKKEEKLEEHFPELPSRSPKIDAKEDSKAPTPSSHKSSKQVEKTDDDFPGLPSRSPKADLKTDSKGPSPSSQKNSKQVAPKPSFAALLKNSAASDAGDNTPCQVDSACEFPSLPIASTKAKNKKKGSVKSVAAEQQAKASEIEAVTATFVETDVNPMPVCQSSGSEAVKDETHLVSETCDSPEDVAPPSENASTNNIGTEQCSTTALEDREESAMEELVEPNPSCQPLLGKKMAAVNSYVGEAVGYLSVDRGDCVQVLSEAVAGDAGCNWPSYIFCQSCKPEAEQGWLPRQVLWELYYDDTGREWITDESIGEWRWVDEVFD